MSNKVTPMKLVSLDATCNIPNLSQAEQPEDLSINPESGMDQALDLTGQPQEAQPIITEQIPKQQSARVILSASKNIINQSVNQSLNNLSNLDKELYEIIINKTLPTEAKWRIYLTILRKDQLMRDKAMWKEPIIV